jgi:hypothetical protein
MDGDLSIDAGEVSMERTAQFRKVAPRQSGNPTSASFGTSHGEAFQPRNLHLVSRTSPKVPCYCLIRTEA